MAAMSFPAEKEEIKAQHAGAEYDGTSVDIITGLVAEGPSPSLTYRQAAT
jgi:hypothetical protein